MAAPGMSSNKDGSQHNQQLMPKSITGQDVHNFNLIIDHVIGSKRKPNPNMLSAMNGIPQVPLSKEEQYIRDFFDSCIFKATASCVIGRLHINLKY